MNNAMNAEPMFSLTSSTAVLQRQLAAEHAADRARLAKARLDLAACERAAAHYARTGSLGGSLSVRSMVARARERVQTLEALVSSVEAEGGVYHDDGRWIALVPA